MDRITTLPLVQDVETPDVFRQLVLAHRALSLLQGMMAGCTDILLFQDLLVLREARESVALDHIRTNAAEVYQQGAHGAISPGATTVFAYARALQQSLELFQAGDGLTPAHMMEIHTVLHGKCDGFQLLPPTHWVDDLTGNISMNLSGTEGSMRLIMNNLAEFINSREPGPPDPLVRAALIHYQFRRIAPFGEETGGTGRILDIGYLVKEQLLSLPVMGLSRYFARHIKQYSWLVEKVREHLLWEEWIVYFLGAIRQSACDSMDFIVKAQEEMQRYTKHIKEHLPRLYSDELISFLFRHPCMKIEQLEKELQISYHTAFRYLDCLEKEGLLEKQKTGRENYYVNRPMMDLLSDEG